MAKDFAARFRIKPGDRVRLAKRDPADTKGFPDKRKARDASLKDGAAIAKLQDRLYAERGRALLVVLQGIDTAGKDGTIAHVFKEVGPRGVMVTPFRRRSRMAERMASALTGSRPLNGSSRMSSLGSGITVEIN